MSYPRDIELVSFTQEANENGMGADTWVFDRIPAEDFYVRHYGREFKLRRQHGNNGWICGYLDFDDVEKLRDACNYILSIKGKVDHER